MEKNKKEKILESALQMFVENGFEGSPTSKIAKNAGVATGTLFHYFKTKEELINMLYLEIKSQLLKKMKIDVEDKPTIKQKIKAIWENSMKWGIDNPYGNKFFSMFGSSPYITKLTREQGFQGFVFVMEIFQAGQTLDVIKKIPLEMLLEMTGAIVHSSTNYFVNNPEKFKDSEFRNEMFLLFWDSIKL